MRDHPPTHLDPRSPLVLDTRDLPRSPGAMRVVERVVPAPWAGHALIDLEVAGKVRVMAVSRLGVAQVPNADLVTQEGDVVYMSVGAEQIDELDAHLGGPTTGGHS